MASPAHPPASQVPTNTVGAELRELIRLGGPIALVQLGMTSLNFVDVAFLGRHDEASLPAMALGNTLVWAAMVFCLGIMTAFDPLLSQAVGAKDEPAVARALLRGAALAVALTLPFTLLLLPAATWLELLGQKPELIGDAALYARINILGFLPFLWFSLLRSLLSSHSRIGMQMLAILVTNGINALCDYALISGNLGLPALGVAGAAWATVICRWLMLFLLAALCWNDVKLHLSGFRQRDLRRRALALQPMLRVLRLGVPIGLQFCLEMGVFAATALLIGTLDADLGADQSGGPRLGGHQIAIQLASLSFMVPVGLGIAASVRVGWAIGRNDPTAARRAAKAVLLAGGGSMSLFMLLFLLVPGPLARMLSTNDEVVGWAMQLIPIAGVFQIVDGLQAVAVGCLRGIGEVRIPMLVNALGFWGVGLPLGMWLAFPWGHGMGPQGLWWGLVAGLAAVAAALMAAVRWHFARDRQRISID